MDSFEINKIAGAILLTLLVVLGLNNLAEILYEPEEANEMAYVVEGLPQEAAPAEAEPAEEEEKPFPVLLANASPDNGARVFRQCQSCHTVEEGGANRIGPNLYNVVGADIAHLDSFNYSGAAADHGGTWTYENLNQWIEAPNDFIPGNKMAFAGVRDAQDRADVIAYLRQYTESPPPLPEAPTTTASAGEAAGTPADETADEAAASDGDEAAPEAQAAAEEEAAAEAEAASDEKAAGHEAATDSNGGDEAASETEAAEEPEEEAAAQDPFAAMVAAADPDDGKRVFRLCQACHTVEKGEGHRIGPNLYNVIGNDIAHRDDFNYSSAIKEEPGAWTYARLSEYLANPNDAIPGNKMAFAGVRKDEQRAAVIAYLRQFADDPPPLPEVEAD